MVTLVSELFKEYKSKLNEDITVEGWVRNVRSSGSLAFIQLNDGTHFTGIQIVLDKKLPNFDDLEDVALSTSIIAKGKLVEGPNKNQPFELQAREIEIEGTSTSDYPLQKKRHTFEYLRTIAHLRPRANAFNAVFRVRSILAYAIHKFYNEKGFVHVHSPIITGADAEGAGEMFKVSGFDFNDVPKTEDGDVDFSKDFFGKETHLTVSGQLNAEAFALAYRNIYTFGPTFRAENSNTPRHAAEFWMMEPEMAFADLNDIMDNAEEMLKYIIEYVLEHAPAEMEFFNKFIDKGLLDRLNNIVESEFARITYTKAIELLEEADHEFEYPVEWGIDLQTEHERYITEEIYKKPVFVTDYPKDIKAFYMRMNDDGKTVAAMDLLVAGVGELIGGSQREERLGVLEDKINEFGLDEEEYWWYLELRKYGGTIHSGFGLGFERAVMYVTGMKNIRDVIPFPRTVRSAEF